MITIRFYRKPSKGTLHMTVRGHSGAAEKGADLVCAGATMLAYTLAQAIQFLWEDGKLERKPMISIREGSCTIIACPKEDCYAETLMAFWVQQCGAHVLARNYPKNVRLEHLSITDTESRP